MRIPEKNGRFYGNVWPFYAGSAGLLNEFLRKCLAVRGETTEKIGQAARDFLHKSARKMGRNSM
jgi:hypothetical protein